VRAGSAAPPAAAAKASSGTAANRLAAGPADLPALTGRVLDETVDLMSVHDSAFVPDASGDGTTMSWGASPEHLKVGYGAGSAERHSALGARAVVEADLRARLDVDTVGDLALARRLGVGSRTAGALHELTGPPAPLRDEA
jgi:2-phospho-L-lactate guanylyltransferase